MVVRNDGPDPASEVQLSIDPPANGTLAASLTLPPNCAQGTLDIFCQYPNLAVGESRALLLAFDIDPGATSTTGISASVGALESDPATGNNAASISTTLVNDLVEVDGFESCDG